MAAYLPPDFDQQFFHNGVVAAGYRLYHWASGTTTTKDVFTDQAGTIPHQQPITLDANGRINPGMFLGPGEYTFALYTDLIGSGGALAMPTRDDVSGVASAQDLTAFAQDIANGVDQSKGADLVGYRGRTVFDRLSDFVSVKDGSGAVGDGVANDTGAIQAAIVAVGDGTLYFPDGTYKVSSTLAVTCNTVMSPGAKFITSGMPANAVVFDVTARTRHEGIRIEGNQIADVASGTIGIRVSGLNASRSTFVNCSAIDLKYGAVVRTFSVTLDDCRFNSNTCNLSASAASGGVQINDLKVRGGNYANPLGAYAVKIGDPEFATTVTAGQPHGQGIALNGFAVDAGTIKIDSALCIQVGTGEPIYHENPASGVGLEISTVGQDGYVGDVEVGPCFYNTMKYAVFCNAGVKGLKVGPSTYTSVSKCALYVMSDIYPFTYETGNATASFTLAPEVHTGRRHATFTAHDFTYVSMPGNGILAGIQTVLNEPDQQLAQSEWREGPTIKRSSPTEYGYGRRYKTPTTGIAGSLTSYLLTLTVASNAKFFNGGDEYALSSGVSGGGIIDRVDYETGIVYLSDASVVSPTACQIEQNASAWISSTRTSTGSPPSTGSWVIGDYCDNTAKAVGNPRGWDRITTGSGNVNGTDWRSVGNLS